MTNAPRTIFSSKTGLLTLAVTFAQSIPHLSHTYPTLIHTLSTRGWTRRCSAREPSAVRLTLKSAHNRRQPVTNYQRGAKVEYRARDQLRALGYYVIRAAGSHGLIDLCALKDGEQPLLIQVKRGRVDQRIFDALNAAPLPSSVTLEVWAWTGRAWQRWRRVGRRRWIALAAEKRSSAHLL